MKTVLRGHYALSVCAAGAMLAGCGGSAQLPNPTALAPVANSRAADRLTSPSNAVPERVGSDTSSTERLAGTAKLSRCDLRTRFRARGVATGPNPGTFTAAGAWGIDFPTQVWFFHESFIITEMDSHERYTDILTPVVLGRPRSLVQRSRTKSFPTRRGW